MATHGTAPVFLPGFTSFRVSGIFASIFLAALCSYPKFTSASPFTPPDLTGFKQHDERSADGDADGVEETSIVQYLNANGDSIVSMSTRGRLWAWSLETRGNQSSVHNYVIRDSDCDGTFDEVYSLDDQFHVPDCLK